MSADPNPPAPPAGVACVTSFVFRVRNIPAALYKAMGGFATNGVNMTKLESYMENGVFTATFFYAEVDGRPERRGSGPRVRGTVVLQRPFRGSRRVRRRSVPRRPRSDRPQPCFLPRPDSQSIVASRTPDTTKVRWMATSQCSLPASDAAPGSSRSHERPQQRDGRNRHDRGDHLHLQAAEIHRAHPVGPVGVVGRTRSARRNSRSRRTSRSAPDCRPATGRSALSAISTAPSRRHRPRVDSSCISSWPNTTRRPPRASTSPR